jgi:hypothetical protein
MVSQDEPFAAQIVVAFAQSLAKTPKILTPNGYRISSNALNGNTHHIDAPPPSPCRRDRAEVFDCKGRGRQEGQWKREPSDRFGIQRSFTPPPKPALRAPPTPSASTLGGTLSGSTPGSGASAAWSQPATPPPPPQKRFRRPRHSTRCRGGGFRLNQRGVVPCAVVWDCTH